MSGWRSRCQDYDSFGSQEAPVLCAMPFGLHVLYSPNALIHSESRTSHYVSHLRAIYISTFAILFFGTPHDRIDIGRWLALLPSYLSGSKRHGHASLDAWEERDAHPLVTEHSLDVIANQFAPHVKKFHMYLFWEELPTQYADKTYFMVESANAAPLMYDAERCGITESNHSEMVKFEHAASAFRIVLSALLKYCHSAPPIIAHRWNEASVSSQRMRRNEASELAGLCYNIPDKFPLSGPHYNEDNRKIPRVETVRLNVYLDLPCPVTGDFLGQEDVLSALQKAFKPEDSFSHAEEQKRFVIYGIGGSGKTQVAAKYAEDNEKQCV